MLDRGERDDWLGSHFIVSFLVIAMAAIALAIWWEWRHDDPVVELTLLRERNFALACIYYFLFAFGLFGSTVMIPEMLQTLFGYTRDRRRPGAGSGRGGDHSARSDSWFESCRESGASGCSARASRSRRFHFSITAD